MLKGTNPKFSKFTRALNRSSNLHPKICHWQHTETSSATNWLCQNRRSSIWTTSKPRSTSWLNCRASLWRCKTGLKCEAARVSDRSRLIKVMFYNMKRTNQNANELRMISATLLQACRLHKRSACLLVSFAKRGNKPRTKYESEVIPWCFSWHSPLKACTVQ